jgi:hypothetical protein
MKNKETVAIAWCDDGKIDTEFGLSIMQLIKDNPKRIGSFYSTNGLGMLAKSRNIAVKHFLENTKDDWLLMIDSDERISSKTFKLLCDTASAERPVVSGLVFIALWNGPNSNFQMIYSGGVHVVLEMSPKINVRQVKFQ